VLWLLALLASEMKPPFLVLRFLLGIFEAGAFPGMVYYITMFYPRTRTQVPMTAIVMGELAMGLDCVAPALQCMCELLLPSLLIQTGHASFPQQVTTAVDGMCFVFLLVPRSGFCWLRGMSAHCRPSCSAADPAHLRAPCRYCWSASVLVLPWLLASSAWTGWVAFGDGEQIVLQRYML